MERWGTILESFKVNWDVKFAPGCTGEGNTPRWLNWLGRSRNILEDEKLSSSLEANVAIYSSWFSL